jgi:hypothetical protein
MFSWFRRRMTVNKIQRAGSRVGAGEHIHVTNPWHAVGISPGKPSCAACQFLKSARFLSSQAPALPLAGCTQPKTCVCKYRHFSDRRAGPRRATESDEFQNALARHRAATLSQERRRSKGRRATDGH